MKKTTAIIAGLGALALFISPVLADNNDTGQPKVEFSDLSLADGSPDDGTCKTRYSSGFTATHKDDKADASQDQTASDDNDGVLIAETDGVVGEGIFTISNTYEIVFDDSTDAPPVEVQMFASGLVGENPIIGVFSDGTCRGHITVHHEDKS
ncbi:MULTISPECIES: hypothetical protein [unclassified Pseudovibrio]|uniref:hypothetical protein n=1 Tax=unclassified Pseudovibrio TaxID=2627060 RepID=UPI0007AE7330|nr:MULTISPECIES: hypothetical protein [unclassified Pseudovibrio]KZL13562.1 hypothetical protein PsAD37_05318 [Pseudovibrio sp. Ad37]KZL23234.1 hypothetical protein PsWM33_03422 [Pseudovibrio sp. WM33]